MLFSLIKTNTNLILVKIQFWLNVYLLQFAFAVNFYERLWWLYNI